MQHMGDITRIDGGAVPPANVIIGGSPCQDLSIAGRRAGLAGERSGLFMEQIRIIKEMRRADAESRGRTGRGIRPRFMVWENVPGAFSSNRGNDFGSVLRETLKVVCEETPVVPVPDNGWPTAGCIQVDGKCSLAWRVFDAQFWGVPQRRRRIALVADFGGLSAPEILFEREGVPGYPPQSGTAWKRIASYPYPGPERDDCLFPKECIVNPAIHIQENCINFAGCNGKNWTENAIYTLNKSPQCVTKNENQHYIIRRLTPLECERLQGFPDCWTEIGAWMDTAGREHKESSDSARYKALGNSIAIPPWFYVLQRLSIACGTDKTMASLFDGIGGFPLIWEGLHGHGSCLWASEIEEFPIAVTTEHFGDYDHGKR